MLYQYYINFLIWELTTLLTYAAANLSFQPIKCSPKATKCFSKCCIIKDDVFKVSNYSFTKEQKRVNMRSMMLFSIAVFFLGNKYLHIDPLTDIYTLLYIPIAPVSAMTMAYLSQVKGLQTSCTILSIKKWPVISWIVYILASCISLPSLAYNFYYIYDDEGLNTFICYNSLLVLIALFEFTLYKLWNPSKYVHIHHLYIGTMGATILRANSPFVIPLAMILYGVGMEGASNYGFPDIFQG